MNLCTSCKEDFSSVPSFDAHRIGVHDYLYAEGLNMTPPREDGRRCLDSEEMETAGWTLDRYGRWVAPGASAHEERDPILARVTL